MHLKKFIENLAILLFGNEDFTITSYAIKTIMKKFPNIFMRIQPNGNTIVFIQKNKVYII